MSRERERVPESILQRAESAVVIAGLIDQRTGTLGRIGSRTAPGVAIRLPESIATGTSLPTGAEIQTAKRIANARRVVAASIDQNTQELAEVEAGLTVDALRAAAPEYLKELQARQDLVALAEGGFLLEARAALPIYTKRLRGFEALSERYPALREGRVQVGGDVEVVKPAEVAVVQDEQADPTLITLPTGEVVQLSTPLSGEDRAILEYLVRAEKRTQADNLIAEFLRGKTRGALHPHLRRIAAALTATGYEIHAQRGRRGGYLFRPKEEAVESKGAPKQVTQEADRSPGVRRDIVEFKPEFGPLTRRDVAVVAEALLAHRPMLNAVLEQSGDGEMDEASMKTTANLSGDIFSKGNELSLEERESELLKMRKGALGRVEQFLQVDDFGVQLKGITGMDENVGMLLLHTSVLRDITGNLADSPKEITGLGFLYALLEDEAVRRSGFKMTASSGQQVIIRERTVIAGKAKVPTIVVESVSSGTIDLRAATGDEAGDRDITPAPLTEEEAEQSEPVVSSATKAPKLRGVEARNPGIRTTIRKLLDEVLSHSELREPVSPASVNRVFSSLTRTAIEPLVEGKLIPNQQGGGSGHYKLDPVAVATALYFIDSRVHSLSARLKKQVKGIVAEEYRKKLAERE